MKREQLERWLADGLSLIEMGRRAGMHPSTVGYWVRKHGLRAANAERFSPRGGLSREDLQPLVERGLTLREIALNLDRSIATVRYWLKRHGMTTTGATPRDAAELPKETMRECARHGRTRAVLEGRGYYRCAACRSEQVVGWRRRAKERLVAEAGGRCALCGYDRYLGALQFHHLERSSKSFGLSVGGITRSIERLREEAAKCVVLCSNCHAEVEGGAAELPGVDSNHQELINSQSCCRYITGDRETIGVPERQDRRSPGGSSADSDRA